MNTTNESETPATRDEVAKLARQIWEREGRQAGRDLEYWLQAEREVLGRRKPESPARPGSATTDTAPSPRTQKSIRLPDSTREPVYTR